jgi:lysophospholipase L1-like esterase
MRSSTAVAVAGVSTQSIVANPSKQLLAFRVNGTGAGSTDVMINGNLHSTLAPRPAKPTGGTLIPTAGFIGAALTNFFGGKIRAIGLHPGQLTEDQLIGIANFIGHSPKKVICVGNSMTFGQGGTAYPTQLAALLPPNFEVFNLGISGQETRDLDQQPNNGVNYQFANFGANFLVSWEGTNDLYYQYFSVDVDPTTAANLAYARWKKHVANMRATRPWARIITGTVLKRGGAGAATYPASFESARVLLNSMLLSGAGPNGPSGDVVRDWASYPEFSDTNNATYFADGTHLTTAGYALIAADLNTALTAL